MPGPLHQPIGQRSHLHLRNDRTRRRRSNCRSSRRAWGLSKPLPRRPATSVCTLVRYTNQALTPEKCIASPAKGLGAGTTGALESFNIEGQFGEGFGTWAVTAPAA